MRLPFATAALAAMTATTTIVAMPALAQTQAAAPRISVVGEGEASVAPDLAIVTLAVMREAATAREALSAANEAMAAVIAAMKEAGIAPRDLQTSGLQINPRYTYPKPEEPNQQPRIDGYQVANTLTVRIRDLAKAGEILDRSVTLGVNQGGGILFTNDDPTATREEARKRAVADAMARAKTLAGAAGVRLGRVLEIGEQSFAQPPMPYAMKAMARDAAESAVPLEAGENSYRIQVNVTFELNQP